MQRPQPISLELDCELLERFLVAFLRDEVARRKGFENALVALSGGVDSAVTAYLATKAFVPAHVHALRLPYRSSSPESLAHAQLVVDALGIHAETVDISAAVDGYAESVTAMSAQRKGNLMARVRMMIGFDKSEEHGALQLGTGNKTERLFGYYTWHGDDAPPVNPLGDLFKMQVWALARHLGVPPEIVAKAPSADLVPGQSDEGDLGIRYARADLILAHCLAGYEDTAIIGLGFTPEEIALVKKRVSRTRWKREPAVYTPVAGTAVDEGYLAQVGL